MTWKILRLSVNTLNGDDKYSLLNTFNLAQHIQMHLSQKLKDFVNCFVHFLNLRQIFNILKKNITLIAYVFINLLTPKDVVR